MSLFTAEGSEILFDQAQIDLLLKSPEGPVAKDLAKRSIKVDGLAKQLCPVDTGRLRSSITWNLGRDTQGLFSLIGSTVDYAIFVHEGHRTRGGDSWVMGNPFLRSALSAAGELGALADALASPAHSAAGQIQFGGSDG